MVLLSPLLPQSCHMTWSSLVMTILNCPCPSCHLEPVFCEHFPRPSASATLYPSHSSEFGGTSECGLSQRQCSCQDCETRGFVSLGTGCRLSQLLSFPTFSSLVSVIYTSKKLTLLNEIALQIASSAWNVARYQSWLASFIPQRQPLGPGEEER